jgi:uncharacterized phiE125 gp8 family phage protein
LPISLTYAKKNLNIDETFTDDDDYLTSLINAATDCFEYYTKTTLMYTVYSTPRNCWSSQIVLKKRPLISITSVKYYDTDEVEQTVSSDDYKMINTTYPYGYIQFRDTFTYPDIADFENQITITFTAGLYNSQDDVPECLKLAIAQWVASAYNNRGDCSEQNMISCLPCATKNAIKKYRIYEI